jgi:hypothetical protein
MLNRASRHKRLSRFTYLLKPTPFLEPPNELLRLSNQLNNGLKRPFASDRPLPLIPRPAISILPLPLRHRQFLFGASHFH